MEYGYVRWGRLELISTDPEYRNALQLVEVLREALAQLEVDAGKIDASFYQDIRELYNSRRASLAAELAEYRQEHVKRSDAEQAAWTSLRQAQHFITVARRDIFHLRERLQASEGESIRDLDRLSFYQEMLLLHEELLEEWVQRKHDIERSLFLGTDQL